MKSYNSGNLHDRRDTLREQNPTIGMNWFKRFWKLFNTPISAKEAAASPTTGSTKTWIESSKAMVEKLKAVKRSISESLNNFTPRAQQVLALSRREADRFNHNFVGTEHLLLGLIALGQGCAVNVLKRLGLDLETARAEVEKQVGTGPDQKMISNISYTPRVKKVLGLAAKEAKMLGHTYVGTEHILLGLLHEGDGVAARVLKNLGVDIERTRLEILKELDPNFDIGKRESVVLPAKKDGPAHPPTMNSAQTLNLAKPPIEQVDLSKQYDVYCSERNREVVVYRNALFKGKRQLCREERCDALLDFYELEQSDGKSVYVAVNSVIKFCAPGTTPNSENVPGNKP